VIQGEDYSVRIDQNDYVNAIEYIPLSTDRQKMIEEPVTEREKEMLRSRIGQVNWLCRISRPDIGYMACVASTSFKAATVKSLVSMNKMIRHLKNTPSMILIAQFKDLASLRLIVYTDASLANLQGGGSQGAHVILLTDGERCCPLVWHSRRVKRVVKSTLAAETLSLVEGCENAIMLSSLIAEVINGDSKSTVPITCLTDNKSLYETAQTTHTL
jgi:hypothetical protein